MRYPKIRPFHSLTLEDGPYDELFLFFLFILYSFCGNLKVKIANSSLTQVTGKGLVIKTSLFNWCLHVHKNYLITFCALANSLNTEITWQSLTFLLSSSRTDLKQNDCQCSRVWMDLLPLERHHLGWKSSHYML